MRGGVVPFGLSVSPSASIGFGVPQQAMGLQQQLNQQHQAMFNQMMQAQAQFSPTPAQQRQMALAMMQAHVLDPASYLEDPDYRAARDLIRETVNHYKEGDDDESDE